MPTAHISVWDHLHYRWVSQDVPVVDGRIEVYLHAGFPGYTAWVPVCSLNPTQPGSFWASLATYNQASATMLQW